MAVGPTVALYLHTRDGCSPEQVQQGILKTLLSLKAHKNILNVIYSHESTCKPAASHHSMST